MSRKTTARDIGREALETVYNRLGPLVRDEYARRQAQPCVTAETFRLRLEDCPRWRRAARWWLRWRWRVWKARCIAAGNSPKLCSED